MRFATTRRSRRLPLFSLAATALALVVLLPSPRQAGAQQQKKSGDALPLFELTALDGKVSKSDKLQMESNWVLVYVRPNCRACEAVSAMGVAGAAARGCYERRRDATKAAAAR